MFEDSTFESAGRLHTRSRGWMIATLIFNSSILLALILIPLIYPEALPRQVMAFLMEVPPPPQAQQPLPRQPAHAVLVQSEARDGQFMAPSRIPKGFLIVDKPEALPAIDTAAMGNETGGQNGPGSLFSGHSASPRVRSESAGPVRVSSMVVEGLLVHKTLPVYPPIGVAARAQGTVVLQATISKTGTIENLHVASGPPVLQQAALDAVKTWRYRPYLLDGQPVEVETTINVIFKLGR
jgi:protein TonB